MREESRNQHSKDSGPHVLPSHLSHRLFLISALVLVPSCWLCCRDRTDVVRVEHKSPDKVPAAYEDGELAGRVVLAAGAESVPVPGARVLAVGTDTGKQVLEHLQAATDPSCLKRLTEMETFLLDSAQASARAGVNPPAATADADGYFVLPHVTPGAYLVIAYGRAGGVQAMWEQPALVESYRGVTVKMADPLLSCSSDEKQTPSKLPPLPAPSQ